MVFWFECHFLRDVSEVFWFESCFSKTTGNGLETDELGLAASLVCRWLCALCAPTPWLGVVWPYFLENSLFVWFSVFFFLDLFDFLIWTLSVRDFRTLAANHLESDFFSMAPNLALRNPKKKNVLHGHLETQNARIQKWTVHRHLETRVTKYQNVFCTGTSKPWPITVSKVFADTRTLRNLPIRYVGT